MSNLLNTRPLSEGMIEAIATQIRVSELTKEFAAWSRRKRFEDEKRLKSILDALIWSTLNPHLERAKANKVLGK